LKELQRHRTDHRSPDANPRALGKCGRADGGKEEVANELKNAQHIVAGIGRNGVEVIARGEEQALPPEARSRLTGFGGATRAGERQILEMDRRVLAWHLANILSRSSEFRDDCTILRIAELPSPIISMPTLRQSARNSQQADASRLRGAPSGSGHHEEHDESDQAPSH
jgi:hypothetical protein